MSSQAITTAHIRTPEMVKAYQFGTDMKIATVVTAVALAVICVLIPKILVFIICAIPAYFCYEAFNIGKNIQTCASDPVLDNAIDHAFRRRITPELVSDAIGKNAPIFRHFFHQKLVEHFQ